MKISTIPTKKLALLCTAFCAAAMLAFTPDAKAITNLQFNDHKVVGTIAPGNGNAQDVAPWVNYMITLGLGNHGNVGNQTVTRSNNSFVNLPNANPNITAAGHFTLGNTIINLGAGGVYTYLFVQYDGFFGGDNSLVWNVASLSGIITIPWLGPNNFSNASSWILFGPDTPGVPDGGTTVMLLGAALGALGVARRYIMR